VAVAEHRKISANNRPERAVAHLFRTGGPLAGPARPRLCSAATHD